MTTPKTPKPGRGGARDGAGRPRNAPELVEIPPAPTGTALQAEAVGFLRHVMNSNEVDMRLRLDAAKALTRLAPAAAPLGVRAAAQEAALAASTGRFGVRPPPGGIKAARHAAAFAATGTDWDDLLPGPDDTTQ